MTPSFMGTLKSARIRTRRPSSWMSLTVFLFICSCPSIRLAPAWRDRSLEVLGHHFHQVRRAAGVTPLIVIPGNHLDHVFEDKRIERAENARKAGATQIGRNQGLIGDAQDPLHQIGRASWR